jgi:hypothetical protein
MTIIVEATRTHAIFARCPRLNINRIAIARKSESNNPFAFNQQDKPIIEPAITIPVNAGFLKPFARRKTATRIGKTDNESGESNSE